MLKHPTHSRAARLGALLAAGSLTACAATMAREPFPDITGMPIKTLSARIGLPDDTLSVAGDKVYVWRLERDYRYNAPSVFYPYWGHRYGPYYGGGYVESRTLRCALKVTVNRAEQVTAWEHDGQPILCDEFARRLNTGDRSGG